MSDVYEKDFTAKSSLSVSDFLRVVGTDNVSYKQLISDVAQCIIESYSGSSVGGTTQSVKTALDDLATLAGDGDLDTTATDLTGAVNEHEGDLIALNSDLNVLDAHMDNAAAELVDIRAGADGTTYSTAGNAVRGQIDDLKENLNSLGLSVVDGAINVTFTV